MLKLACALSRHCIWLAHLLSEAGQVSPTAGSQELAGSPQACQPICCLGPCCPLPRVSQGCHPIPRASHLPLIPQGSSSTSPGLPSLLQLGCHRCHGAESSSEVGSSMREVLLPCLLPRGSASHSGELGAARRAMSGDLECHSYPRLPGEGGTIHSLPAWIRPVIHHLPLKSLLTTPHCSSWLTCGWQYYPRAANKKGESTHHCYCSLGWAQSEE